VQLPVLGGERVEEGPVEVGETVLPVEILVVEPG
jgi:hypothetical protein